MMNKPSLSTIRVRYGLYPVVTICMIGIIAAAFASPIGSVIITVITLPFVIMVSTRPFLLVTDGNARFVSLISDQIFRPIGQEELFAQLPAMRWFLRKCDLTLLSRSEIQTTHRTEREE
jgi:hypothetical protein